MEKEQFEEVYRKGAIRGFIWGCNVTIVTMGGLWLLHILTITP